MGQGPSPGKLITVGQGSSPSEMITVGRARSQRNDHVGQGSNPSEMITVGQGFSPDAAAAAAELQQIIDLSAQTSAGVHVRFDPSLARGLSYYTGAIMEISVPDLAGSLGGGGRYDDLVGMFSGEQVPACGFSLGLERILVVMSERGMFPARVQKASADVLVALFDDALIPARWRWPRSSGARACARNSIPKPTSSGSR